MNRIDFKDLPDTSTPYNAETFNTLQNNIENEFNKTNQQDITTGGEAVKCGYKIDGKDVYVKRINFGALPNNSIKEVATGIAIAEHEIIKIEGYCKSKTNNVGFPLPFSNPLTLSYGIMVNMTDAGEISITTASDRTLYDAWFNIYYI